MRTLLKTVETFRVDSEAEAKELIEEMKENASEEDYTVTNYSSTYKEKKKKGEVIDSGYEVKITKAFAPFWPEDL